MAEMIFFSKKSKYFFKTDMYEKYKCYYFN